MLVLCLLPPVMGSLAAILLLLPQERRRVMLSLVLVLSGYLIVAGIFHGRTNPLLSSSGSCRDLLILLLAAQILALVSGRETLPPLKSFGELLKPDFLLYLAIYLLGLSFGFLQKVKCINYSLKGAHLSSMPWPVILLFGSVAFGVILLMAFHFKLAAKAKMLPLYAGLFAGLIASVSAITLLLRQTHYLHLHHYFYCGCLAFLWRFRHPASRYMQALALGICLDGAASYGIETLWYPY